MTILWLFAAWMANAQKFEEVPVSDKSNRLEVSVSGSSGIHLKTSLGTFKTSEVKTEEGEFFMLTSDGYYSGGEEGKPQLPVQNRLFIIPPGMNADVRVIRYNDREIKLGELGIDRFILPLQPSLPKRQLNERVKFSFDRKAYKLDEYQGQELVSIEILGSMRGQRIGRISISPFAYNPVRNRLKVITEAEIEIVFTRDQSSSKSVGNVKGTPYDDFIFRNFLNSPQNMLKSAGLPAGPMKYVILSDPMFRDALVPFVEWKIKKGFEVIEVYKGENGVGTTNTAMRSSLKNIYDNSLPGSPPVFLLIVGDHEQIPAFSASGHVTDLYYAEYDGDGDYFPELFYGRFSAQTVEQLIPQIEKTLMYEKYEFPDPSFLDEVVMIAGVDGRYATTHGNGHINYAVYNYLNEDFSIQSHTYLYPESGQSANAIIQNISDGAGFVNYTGHGKTDRWDGPLLHMNSIDTLENYGKYPLVIGNGCQTARFNVSVSLGEAFLRADGKGAVGYIGGTNDTYWNEDYYWAVGLGPIISNPSYGETALGMFDKTFHLNGEPEEVWAITQGQMIHAGNMAVTEGGSRVKFYWEVYHLMGDPSVMTYFSQASVQTPVFSQQIPVGSDKFLVQAEPYSYVALSQGTILYDAKHTSQSGIAELNFPVIAEPGHLALVVTKYQRQPFITNITVADFAEPYVVYRSLLVNDQSANNNGVAESGETFSLDIIVKNYGSANAADLSLFISTEDPYLSITVEQEQISEIEAGAEVLLNNAFGISVNSLVPDKHQAAFRLSVRNDTGDEWNSLFFVEIRAPVLAVKSIWFDDINGEKVNLRAGEKAWLKVELENTGGAVAENCAAFLSTENISVQIPVSSLSLGALLIGEPLVIGFEMELPVDFPYGLTADFLLHIQAANSAMEQTIQLVLNGLYDDLESADLEFFPWVNESALPWFVAENSGVNNSHAARSGAITHNQSSSLSIQVHVPEESDISFWLKVSSEKGYDFLRFYINDVHIERWSGIEVWKKVSFLVEPGVNEFRWTYTKDGSISRGEDAAWIDNILFPDGSFIISEDIYDLGIISVLKPVSGDEMTDIQVIEVEVKNFGNIPLNDFPIVYVINSASPVQETMIGGILPGEVKIYTFSNTGDFSAKGDYILRIYTDHVLDMNRLNDTLLVTVTHLDPSGIIGPLTGEDIVVFPNPARGKVNIKIPAEPAGPVSSIRITDLSGRIIRDYRVDISKDITELSLSGIAPGIYLISVICPGKTYSTNIYVY